MLCTAVKVYYIRYIPRPFGAPRDGNDNIGDFQLTVCSN